MIYTFFMDTDYQQYLSSLHSESATTDLAISDFVKKTTRESLKSSERIIAGEVNEVYRIILESGRRVILRIAKKDSTEFQIESYAMNQAKKVGVPVPTVIEIAELSTADNELSFCLMDEIKGSPMERGNLRFHQLQQDEQKQLLFRSGQILSRIHLVATIGFGPYINPGEAEYLQFDDLLLEYSSKEQLLIFIANEIGFDPELIKRALHLIDINKQLLADCKPCLNHGDFGPKHIMVSNSTITGIIDWGLARSDSPVTDLAYWSYWFNDYPIKWLLEGYENKVLFDDSFESKIRLHKIMKGLVVIEWYHGQRYKNEVDVAVKKLMDDLKHFK